MTPTSKGTNVEPQVLAHLTIGPHPLPVVLAGGKPVLAVDPPVELRRETIDPAKAGPALRVIFTDGGSVTMPVGLWLDCNLARFVIERLMGRAFAEFSDPEFTDADWRAMVLDACDSCGCLEVAS